VTVDQLKTLFSFCGSVVDCRVAGEGKQFAFVEYATHAEAGTSLCPCDALLTHSCHPPDTLLTPS
jgi:hypothetical protein